MREQDKIDILLNTFRELPEFEKCRRPPKFTAATLREWESEDLRAIDIINAFLDKVIAILRPVAVLCVAVLAIIFIIFWAIPGIKYAENPGKLAELGTYEIFSKDEAIYDYIEIEWNKGVPAPTKMTIDGKVFKVVVNNEN